MALQNRQDDVEGFVQEYTGFLFQWQPPSGDGENGHGTSRPDVTFSTMKNN